MPGLSDLLDILRDPLAMFLLAIVIGLILIIIAAVPSLSIFILKNTSFSLDKKQSTKVAAIGGVLIVIGLVGIIALYQYEIAQPRATGEVEISPQTPATVPNELNITVLTENPNPNRLQKILFKIFGEPKDLEFTFSLLDQSGNGTIHTGKMPNNHLNLKIYPTDAGLKIIQVDALSPRNETIYKSEYVINLPKNLSPTIEHVSSRKIDKKLIEIAVDAKDPENDTIYYYFNLISLSNASVLQIPPIGGSYTENSTFWHLSENGKEYLLRVYIKDGDPKKSVPFNDRIPVYNKKLDISI